MAAGVRIDDAEFLRLYHAKATRQQIADAVGVKRQQVRVICKRLGVPPVPPEPRVLVGNALERVDREMVKTLTEEGKTVTEVARMVGCKPRTVNRIRRQLGIAKGDQHPGYPPEVKAKALEMLDGEASYNEVARTLKVPAKTVSKWYPGRGWTHQQAIEYRNMLKAMEKLDTPADRRVYSNL